MNRAMLFAITAALSSVAMACTYMKYVPPETVVVQTSAVFQAEYDEVWNAAVDWFATRNIDLGKLDKSSGYLNAEHALVGNNDVLSCGTLVVTNEGLGSDPGEAELARTQHRK